MNNYFYLSAGAEPRGPFSIDQMNQLLGDGTLDGKTLVTRRPAENGWSCLGELAEFRGALAAPVKQKKPKIEDGNGSQTAEVKKPKPWNGQDVYVFTSGAARGPYTETQLRSMWLAGSLTGDTLFKPVDSDGWAPLATVSHRLESAVKIQTEKVRIAARPVPSDDMVGFVILTLILPIAGLIAGLMWVRQPGKKHDQAVNLIVLSIIVSIVWAVIAVAAMQ